MQSVFSNYDESSCEESIPPFAPYKGLSSSKLYQWFDDTLLKIKNDDEYQKQKIMNETFTKMMREGYEEAKKRIL